MTDSCKKNGMQWHVVLIYGCDCFLNLIFRMEGLLQHSAAKIQAAVAVALEL